MKELLESIIAPYKKIRDLEKEIENQDKQYTYLQSKNTKLKNKLEEYETDNIQLAKLVEEYKEKCKKLRKELKALQNENKTSRENS